MIKFINIFTIQGLEGREKSKIITDAAMMSLKFLLNTFPCYTTSYQLVGRDFVCLLFKLAS